MAAECRIYNEFTAMLQDAWQDVAKNVMDANLESRYLTGRAINARQFATPGPRGNSSVSIYETGSLDYASRAPEG
jgi:hypothetical protein